MRFVSLAAALGVTKPEVGLPGSLAQDVFGFTTLSKPHRLRPLLMVQARMKSVFQAYLRQSYHPAFGRSGGTRGIAAKEGLTVSQLWASAPCSRAHASRTSIHLLPFSHG